MIKETHYPRIFFSIILLLWISSCTRAPKSIAFPKHEGEFIQPVRQRLLLGKPQKLDWQYIDLDTTKYVTEKKFDISTLPKNPFYLDERVPLTTPMADTLINLEASPTTPFTLDTLSSKPFKFELAALGQPTRTKAGIPRLRDNASENILQFTLDQGLPGTTVFSFAQDKAGSLWITTDGGLCRYDGEFCDVYSIQQGLSKAALDKLFIDQRGLVYVSYRFINAGLSIIDRKNGLVKGLSKQQGLSNDFIRNIIEDRQGRIWVSTNVGINIVDVDKKTISVLNKDNGLSGNAIGAILNDRNGNIWISYADATGIDIIEPQNKLIRHIGKEKGFNGKIIVNMAEDEQGKIWAGTRKNGVIIIDPANGQLNYLNTKNGLAADNVSEICPYRDGRTLINVYGGGMDIFDEKKSTLKHIGTKQGLSNDNTFGVFVDRNGYAWIGTNGGEANIYNISTTTFLHVNSKILDNHSSFIYGLTQDSMGRVWVGSFESMDVIDEKNNTITKLPFTTNSLLYTDKQGRVWMSNGNTLSMYDEKKHVLREYSPGPGFGGIIEDKQGQLIIGAPGLFFFDETNRRFKYIQKKNGLASNQVQSITLDRAGKIWVATANGIDIIDEERQMVKHVMTKELETVIVSSVFMDHAGKLWLATFGKGIWMIDEEDNSVTKFTLDNGLPDMSGYSINERDGDIYIGTGKGIAIISANRKKNSDEPVWQIKSYSKPQGMLRIDHNPRSLTTTDGRLWFGIADLLTVMNRPGNDSLVPAAAINGVSIKGQSSNFFKPAIQKETLTSADTIWTSIRDTFYTNGTSPALTGYLQENKIRWDSVAGPFDLPVNLSLPYDQNYLVFNFTGNHLNNQNKTRYRSVLEGNDKAWSNVSQASFAEYRNLSPGKYNFKVSSMGINGKWSDSAVFSFTIRPPWWSTWWAYTLYAVIFLWALRVFSKFRERRLRFEKEKLELKVTHRTQQLQDSIESLKTTQSQLVQSEKMASLGELTAGIAHEIQNPLNFVNNFSEVNKELIGEMKEEIEKGNYVEVKTIAKDIEENEEKINHHGKRADAIVKGMLQHSRSSSGVKEPTDINALCDEYLRLSYHGLRAKDKSFNAAMKTDFDPTIGNINIIPQDIGRVILNLLTNAFYVVNEKKLQHPQGYEPTVTIATRALRPHSGSLGVEIRVSDNGNGIPQKVLDKIFQPFFTTKPTGQGTGLGLSLSYDIVTKGHGGELKVETNEARPDNPVGREEGTAFIITLPV